MEELRGIILGTGNYKRITSGNTVSISTDLLDSFNGKYFKKLAPSKDIYYSYLSKLDKLNNNDKLDSKEYSLMKKAIISKYIESYYKTRLENLDIYDLLIMMEKKFGKDIILVSNEDIKEVSPRRLIADYIELKTRIYTPEIEVIDGSIKKINPKRYMKELNKEINRI